MLRFKTRSNTTVGLAPGTMVHVGDQKVAKTRITVMDYDEAHLEEREVDCAEACAVFRTTPTVTWVNVVGLHDLATIEKLGQEFGLHPLLLEDVVNTDQRSKTEDFENYLFSVLKMVIYNAQEDEIQVEQVSLVMGDGFVISFQEAPGDVFDPVRDRIRKSGSRLRSLKADYLAYALIDAIVDGYFVVLEHLGDRIEGVEDQLIADPTPAALQEMHDLRQEMIVLRKSAWPLREVVTGVERADSSLVQPSTAVYLRDVQDHVFQIVDAIETFRDMVASMMDIYLSSISNRLNSVMKVLTIIATIFIPLTFIVGLYGMNFRHMPELEWRWGYPMVLAVIATVVVFMLSYFRRRRWL